MRRIDEQEESDDEIRDLKEKLRMRREEIYSSRHRKLKPRKPSANRLAKIPGNSFSSLHVELKRHVKDFETFYFHFGSRIWISITILFTI